MTKNQFFYQRREQIPPSEGETEIKFRNFRDSFNVDMIIRSLELDNGRVLVLLNDIHERPQEIPIKSNKGTITGYKRERNVFQTEITLENSEDVERFYKLTTIE